MCRRYEGVLFQFQNVPEEHLLAGPKFHLNTSNGSGIIKKIILFFKSYKYKKFSPAETSEISEFW